MLLGCCCYGIWLALKMGQAISYGMPGISEMLADIDALNYN